MLSNIDKLEYGFKGANHKHISKEYLNSLNIPIPSKEKQKEIVEYCDNLSNMIDNMENQITKNTELMKNILENYLNTRSNDKKKKVIEVSDIKDDELSEEKEIVNTVEDQHEELSEINEVTKAMIVVKRKKKNKKSKTADNLNDVLVDNEDTKPKKKKKRIKVIKRT